MMSRFDKWIPAVLALAGLALLGAPRDAHALLVLEGTITPAGGPTFTVYATDGNAGYPGGPPPGGIMLNDTDLSTNGSITLAPGSIFSGYSVASSSTFESKALGSNILTSNALQIVNTTGVTVTTNIAVGDNNFVGPANTVVASDSGTWTNAAGSVYSTFFYNDPANAQPLAGPNYINSIAGLFTTDSHTVVGTADSYGSGPLGPFTVNDPGNFAMTLRFNFTLVNGGTFVSRGQNELKTSAIPEPGTIAMVLSGLPALGLLWGRRRCLQA